MKEKVEKAINLAKPLISHKDYQDLESENYANAGKRIRLRAWIMMLALLISGILFSINSFSHLFRYLESAGDTGFPYLAIAWAGLAIWAVIYGAIHGRRMLVSGHWLIKQGNKN